MVHSHNGLLLGYKNKDTKRNCCSVCWSPPTSPPLSPRGLSRPSLFKRLAALGTPLTIPPGHCPLARRPQAPWHSCGHCFPIPVPASFFLILLLNVTSPRVLVFFSFHTTIPIPTKWFLSPCRWLSATSSADSAPKSEFLLSCPVPTCFLPCICGS